MQPVRQTQRLHSRDPASRISFQVVFRRLRARIDPGTSANAAAGQVLAGPSTDADRDDAEVGVESQSPGTGVSPGSTSGPPLRVDGAGQLLDRITDQRQEQFTVTTNIRWQGKLRSRKEVRSSIRWSGTEK
jgi:hypothetical protein